MTHARRSPASSSNSTTADWDAIVVGSGIGGLAAAAVLARWQKKRVLVLERHYVAGGFTHEFHRRDGRRWDVGVHYVGDMAPGAIGRALFEYISDGPVDWRRMAEPFERFVYPDFTFDCHGDPERYRGDLVQRFPAERAAIERYFRDVAAVNAWGMRELAARTMPPLVAAPLRAWQRATSSMALGTTADYLERNFRDPKLRALLASQWRTYGLVPERSAFLVHAVIVNHYLRGGWYPAGGASSIARAIVAVIERAGGRVLLRRDVRRVLLEGGRACGVEAVRARAGSSDGVAEVETYRAPLVISDAGAWATYAKLLPPELGAERALELEALAAPPTSVTLYLGLKRSPSELGLRGENYWIHEHYDHDERRETDECLAGRPRGAYVSFPSLKDPHATHHTAEVLCLPEYAPFAHWADQRWHHRGAGYEELKERIARGMLELADRHLPGLAGLVEYRELSTPLSVEHFTAWQGGAIYGLAPTPERFRIPWLGPRTNVPGLVLAGADVYLHGILGALMGGVAAAGEAVAVAGFPRIVAAAMREHAGRRRREPAGAAAAEAARRGGAEVAVPSRAAKASRVA